MSRRCMYAVAPLLGMAAALDGDCFTVGSAYNDTAALVPNTVPVTSALACQSLCEQQSATCSYFTFYNNTQTCWLQGKNVSAFAESNATSGPAKCPSEVSEVTTTSASELTTPVSDATELSEAKAIWEQVVGGKALLFGVASSGLASSPTISTGLKYSELAGKTVVVHDATGARVACSPLVPYVGDLAANDFSQYPGYVGPLSVTGIVSFKSDGAGEQTMTYKLKGTDPTCGTKNSTAVANACGIHIHAGASCAVAGPHFFNHTTDSTDPWQSITYVSEPAASVQDLTALGEPTGYTRPAAETYAYSWKNGPNITVQSQLGALTVTGIEGTFPLKKPTTREITTDDATERDTGKKDESGGFPTWLIIVLSLLALGLCGAGAFYFLRQGGDSKKKKKTSKKTESESRAADPVADPESQAPLMEESKAGTAPAPFTITGQQMVPSVTSPISMIQPVAPAPAMYTVSGGTAPAQYTISGAAIPAQYSVSAAVPQYTMTGATAPTQYSVAAAPAQYTVTGAVAPAQYSVAPAQYTVSGAAAPQYTISGPLA